MAFFPQYPNPQVGMGPDQGPVRGTDPYTNKPTLDPKMDMSTSQVPGAPQSPVKQPGNRRSIKEYLEEIKYMQSQGQGVVPTFTNIQGGPMDQVQGTIEGQDVQSYVNPEYVQGEGGAMTRGEAHPVSQAQQGAFGETGGEGEETSNSWMEDGWPNQRAMQDSDEIMAALDQQLGRNATPDEQMQALNQYRVSLYEKQSDLWADMEKKYKDASTKEIMTAFKTGDFEKIRNASKDLFSDKNVEERKVSLGEEYLEYTKENQTVPDHEDTGEPFVDIEDYVNYYMNQYEESMTAILNKAASQSGEETGGVDPKLQAVLEKLPTKKGNDGKDYVTYEGRNYLIGA